MDQFLTGADARVLGALIEKQMATPDSYPLSLNALIAACNQTSNRHPIVSFDEATVLAAIQRLRRNALVRGIQRIDSRVTRYEHTASETLDVTPNELALLCVLLLRGPNTVGELRTRTERLAKFESLADVESTLDGLIQREKDPPVMRLSRKPGQKEVRYAHLLSGEAAAESTDVPAVAASAAPESAAALPVTVAVSVAPPSDDRLEALEGTVAALRHEVSDLRQQLDQFRKQFE